VADINVERKQPSVWPWVIGLIVLALVIWALVEMFGGNDGTAGMDVDADTTAVETPGATTPPAAAPVPGPATPAPGAAVDTSGLIPDTALP
jgi:hypothetical protein